MATIESSLQGSPERSTPYEKWLEKEGLPVIKGYYIEDLRKVPLAPWERKGGLGAFINLEGSEQADDAYLCEIPPGSKLKPQRHFFEEIIYILSGQGATTVWNEGGPKQTFEWQEGSLFSLPLNAWHHHFNGQGDKPARYIAVTSAPLMINLIHNLDFIFNNSFVFTDRYNAEEGYFSARGTSLPWRIWESNLVPDVKSFKLLEWKERGAGGTNIRFEMANNTMIAHISEFPVGTYKKAHRHGPGYHIVIISGKGYSLMWQEDQPPMRIDWQVGSMFVPPDRWFHQHFNTGREPSRYLAFHWGDRRSKYGGLGRAFTQDTSTRLGGDQIEYEDEDPQVRRMYEEALAREGIEIKMP